MANEKYAHNHASLLAGSSSRDTTNANKRVDVSHLTGTIEYSNWVTIDVVIFYIHVDSAFHTTIFRPGRLAGLDAAPQTTVMR